MSKSLAFLILVASIAFAGSPLWVPEFGGFEADQFPIPQLNAAVQPAGYAFAIWGPIFTWLVVAAVYGLWKRATVSTWSAMRPALLVSLAIGTAWLPVASLSPVWAAILIWLMLIPSVVALFRSPHEDQVWASWPIGLYAGWLSAASFAAIGLLLGGVRMGQRTNGGNDLREPCQYHGLCHPMAFGPCPYLWDFRHLGANRHCGGQRICFGQRCTSCHRGCHCNALAHL